MVEPHPAQDLSGEAAPVLAEGADHHRVEVGDVEDPVAPCEVRGRVPCHPADGVPGQPVSREEGGKRPRGVRFLDEEPVPVLPEPAAGEAELEEAPVDGGENLLAAALALHACAELGERAEALAVARALAHVDEDAEHLVPAAHVAELHPDGAAAGGEDRGLVDGGRGLERGLAPEECLDLAERVDGEEARDRLAEQVLRRELEQRRERPVDPDKGAPTDDVGGEREVVELGAHGRPPSPRSTRLSPTRSVTRSRSKYSASGITCLRVAPTRSLNSGVEISR